MAFDLFHLFGGKELNLFELMKNEKGDVHKLLQDIARIKKLMQGVEGLFQNIEISQRKNSKKLTIKTQYVYEAAAKKEMQDVGALVGQIALQMEELESAVDSAIKLENNPTGLIKLEERIEALSLELGVKFRQLRAMIEDEDSFFKQFMKSLLTPEMKEIIEGMARVFSRILNVVLVDQSIVAGNASTAAAARVAAQRYQVTQQLGR